MKRSIVQPFLPVVLAIALLGCLGSGGGSVHRADLEWRIFHFPLIDITPARAKWLVDRAQVAGFNAVQVIVREGVILDNAPWTPHANAWSKAELSDWISYTQSRGMQIIPELKLLSHQEKFFQGNYPELMLNTVTYDPTKEETYRVVYALLDEIIATFHPVAIHIGHDEVKSPRRNRRRVGADERALSAALFLQDVLRLHAYLRAKGIATWMWGDMLISPREFPGMLSRHLHGVDRGYGKPLRDQLPRDIVICDWHYFDQQRAFPSLLALQNEGFRVIGATWSDTRTISNFTQYAMEHRAYGMMATLWHAAREPDGSAADRILQTSGEHFRKSTAAP